MKKTVFYVLGFIFVVSSLLLSACGSEEVKADYSQLTSDNVQTALKNTKWEADHRKITEAKIDNGKVIIKAETIVGTTQNFDKIKTFIKDDLKELHNFKDITEVIVQYSTELKDSYGNMNQKHVVTGHISGDNLHKINFDNFYADDLDNVMSFDYVLPVIK